MASITNFRSWFRSRNQPQVFQNLFYSLSNAFSKTTITDKKAIEEGYLGNDVWYSVVSNIAENVSSLPIGLYAKGKDGELTEVTDGEVFEQVFKPNTDQTFRELLEEQTIFLCNTGEAYFFTPVRSVGFKAKSVIPIPPELVTVKLTSESIFAEVKHYEINDNGEKKEIKPDNILHIRLPNPSIQGRKTRNGLSPLQAGYNRLMASNQNAIGQASYFKNRGVSTILSATGGAHGLVLQDADKKAIDQANIDRLGGANNMNKVITVGTPMSKIELGASSSDMRMIEHDVEFLRALCNLLHLPSQLFNDPQGKTYNNMKEARIAATLNCYIPKAKLFLEGYERSILKDYNKDGVRYCLLVKMDEVESLQPDPFEAKKLAQDEVVKGLKTRNEYRLQFNEEPLPFEEMDVPAVQQAIIPINQPQDGGQKES